MELSTSLIITLVVMVIVYLLFRYFFLLVPWSSLVLSVLIGGILLPFLYPWSRVSLSFGNGAANTIYLLFMIFAVVLILFYIITTAFSRREINKTDLPTFATVLSYPLTQNSLGQL